MGSCGPQGGSPSVAKEDGTGGEGDAADSGAALPQLAAGAAAAEAKGAPERGCAVGPKWRHSRSLSMLVQAAVLAGVVSRKSGLSFTWSARGQVGAEGDVR